MFRPSLHQHLLTGKQSLRALLCIASLLAYALLFEPLGFIPRTALAAAGLGLLFGGRPLPCAISGVLMGVLLYTLFDLLLDVPLPLGVFEFLVE
ncbi:Tripartite tricarboxylate transporter TctB family protein [compost metagenome]